MDMEFEKIEDNFDKVEVNTTIALEHVGEMEQGIWLVKEQSQYVISEIRPAGFAYLHKMIVVHCVYFVDMMLNDIPAKSGILKKYPHMKFSQVKRLTWKKIAEQSLMHMLKQAKMPT